MIMDEQSETDKSIGVAIALDLGGTNLRGAIVDQTGKVSGHLEKKTAIDRGTKDVMDQLIEMIHQLTSKKITRNAHLLGIGIGIPGFIDSENKSIVASPNFPTWRHFPVVRYLQDDISYPIVVENDANCFVLGESWKGAAQGCQNVLGLTLGTGVGGGGVVAGRMLQGSHGGAGEFGHINVEPNGRPCGCGGRGCLEQYASGDALQKYTARSAEDWYEKAKEGRKDALELYSQIGKVLGLALSSLCFLFDPEIVVIGGRLSRAFSFFESSLLREFRWRVQKHPALKTKIVRTSCEDDAALLGAAKAVFQRLIISPS